MNESEHRPPFYKLANGMLAEITDEDEYAEAWKADWEREWGDFQFAMQVAQLRIKFMDDGIS